MAAVQETTKLANATLGVSVRSLSVALKVSDIAQGNQELLVTTEGKIDEANKRLDDSINFSMELLVIFTFSSDSQIVQFSDIYPTTGPCRAFLKGSLQHHGRSEDRGNALSEPHAKSLAHFLLVSPSRPRPLGLEPVWICPLVCRVGPPWSGPWDLAHLPPFKV